MPENSFILNVRTKTLEEGMKLVQSLRSANEKTQGLSEDNLLEVVEKELGNRFADVLRLPFMAEEDIKNYEPFNDESVFNDHNWELLKMLSRNKERLWIGIRDSEISSECFLPEYIQINTRIRDYGDYYTQIELSYEMCEEEAKIKSCVLAKAFTDLGCRVSIEAQTSDEEEEY